MNELPDWERELPLDVGAHVYENTTIRHHVYATENRVTVIIDGNNRARVTLYLSAVQLYRLRDSLTVVIADFESERAALTDPEVTDSAA